MKILILGGDGYLGWPTALYLSNKEFDVGIVDNFFRRLWDLNLGTESLTPIYSLHERVKTWEKETGKKLETFIGDITDYKFIELVIEKFSPDAIVHFAEQRCAPFSMRRRKFSAKLWNHEVVFFKITRYHVAFYSTEKRRLL